MKTKLLRLLPAAVLILYFLANLHTLLAFPLVHSDELWLKGITDEMLRQKSFAVTEPFFDLYPRVVHPFRLLFHLVQALFFQSFGSSVWTARFLSLVTSIASLAVFWNILRRSSRSRLLPIIGTASLAFNFQFIYSAHFGRQDSLILLLLLTVYDFAVHRRFSAIKLSLFLAAITILGMLVHPNSLLIGILAFALLIIKISCKEAPKKVLGFYTLFTSAGFGLILLIGNLLNPGFLIGYIQFGESLGIESTPMGRIEGFYWYWFKLFRQIGGTYELLDLRPEILLLVSMLLLLPCLTFFARKKHNHLLPKLWEPWVSLLGINLGLLFIGRYNQTSVVFLIPFLLLAVINGIDTLAEITASRKWAILVSLALLLLIPARLYHEVQNYAISQPYKLGYKVMLKKIDDAVDDHAVILGNLNTIEAFDGQVFYDIRNLAFLDEQKTSLEEYIRERGITIIVLHEEMDYIRETAPSWDFLYGSDSYLDDLFAYVDEHTDFLVEFENPQYAMRIAKYAGTYPWKTKIYRVKP
ncbi:glycosyltransferase family 39 protein [Proteiniclasticum sp. BAD-10]|uniref:Glycosyltransferase family 39 protein n=1 Tax=Proteiniclasticum sediminis TaxID=2804028 RepID=A0A941CQX5_9CLOT|nr:glycosyltransferase family 39 protein [Proteiniclasticum sediminis]MBR0577265.1 glycosyltransferase family 39 protein [Proteiniclasticum sediminis]